MVQVQVVEYVFFICLYCVFFYNNVFKLLKENYIDIGKICFVFCEVYFDQFGLVVLMIGCCFGDSENYFCFVDKVFSQQ